MKTLVKLRREMEIAFRRTSPPGASNISTYGGKEAQDLIESFSGIRWWEADDSLIDANYDKLPLFTDAAFHYYFPAYLMRCVDNFSSENLVLEFLIYSLEPKHYIDANHFQARFVLFSSRERNVVLEFLKRVLSNESIKWHHPDAATALQSLPG